MNRAKIILVATMALGLAGSALAQVGHPVKGSWSGYWGTSDTDKTRILLVLDWHDNRITGTINPGPKQVPIRNAELDVSSWTLKLEADMPKANGQTAPFVVTGKLTNLGSWTTRTYSGSYVFGDEHGKFTVTIN